MRNSHEAEARSRTSLVRDVVAVNQLGRKVVATQTAHRTAEEKYMAFRRDHGHVGDMAFRERTRAILTLLGLFAIYILDLYLFGPAAEYLGAALGGSVFLALIAKYLLPLMFLTIEVWLGIHIEETRVEAEEGHGSPAARWFWLCVGILLALFMPCMAIAGASATAAVGGDSRGALIIALGILSVVAHLIVLFGGRLTEEAKVYFIFSLTNARLERRLRQAKRRLDRILARFTTRFIRYVHAWRLHGQTFSPLPSGPFDDEVVELLERQFSTVTITGTRTAFPVAVEGGTEEMA
jgi:hypothetical protein